MGRIVACPTAGSCGIVPAAVLSVADEHALPREAVVRSLLTAGLVGQIIGEHACLAGAQGGCQAECGSASAMAAAAVVELLGGAPAQSFDAAPFPLKICWVLSATLWQDWWRSPASSGMPEAS